MCNAPPIKKVGVHLHSLHPLLLPLCERRLNNTRRHLHMSRRYTHLLRPVAIYSLCECFMSVIPVRWLVVQEVCSRFEFARHFESHLAQPPSFYMRMRTTISDEHSIVTMLLSTRIILSTYSFKSLFVSQAQP